MNIKKLLIPVIAIIIVIIALIIGVALINKPQENNQDKPEATAPSHIETSTDTDLKEADRAFAKGDYEKALGLLEKVRMAYQDSDKKREADEINDKIESIKALHANQKTTSNSNKVPAPISE